MQPTIRSTSSHRAALHALGGFAALFVAVWLATLALGVVPNMLLRALQLPDLSRLWADAGLSRVGMLAASVWLSAVALRRVTGLRAAETLYARHPGWWRDLAAGAGLGALAMLALLALEVALGWLVVDGWHLAGAPPARWLHAAWLALLVNALPAVGEEAMFRGYLQTALRRAWGTWPAILATALPFGAAHLLVRGAAETSALLFVLLLALPGVLLGWAAARSGSLWLPMGLHFSWNLLQTDLLNLTGADGPYLVGLATRRTGPDWFTGTTYGIETGAAGVVALLVVALGIWLWTSGGGRRSRPAAAPQTEREPAAPAIGGR